MLEDEVAKMEKALEKQERKEARKSRKSTHHSKSSSSSKKKNSGNENSEVVDLVRRKSLEDMNPAEIAKLNDFTNDFKTVPRKEERKENERR